MTMSYISSKASGIIVTKLHIVLPGAEGMKICSNSPGHMSNVATTL